MSIRSQSEFEKLRVIGRIVRRVLDAAAAAVRPGITTGELDEFAGRALAQNGAISAPPKVYGFPGHLCISVNDEAIHGVPGSREIHAGDLVKLDLVAEKDGFFADAAVTVSAGVPNDTARRLVRCAESAFHLATRAARPGNRVYEIGRVVERETRRCERPELHRVSSNADPPSARFISSRQTHIRRSAGRSSSTRLGSIVCLRAG